MELLVNEIESGNRPPPRRLWPFLARPPAHAVCRVTRAPTRDSSDTPATTEAPGVVEELVRQAERAGASDIHLQMSGDTAQVSFRLDGVMTPVRTLPAGLAPLVFGRI